MNKSESDSSKKGGFLSRLFGKTSVQPEPESAPKLKSASKPGAVEISMSAEEPAGRRLAKSKSVLVIAEDDSTSRRWRRELQEWGYGVEFTNEGEKGLDILYNVAFDALLLDLKGSKIDGFDVLRRIRAQDELKTLFISAFIKEKEGTQEQEAAGIDAGANRIFQRGKVNVDEILTALKTALFPRILQVQPRSKQQTPAAAAANSAAP